MSALDEKKLESLCSALDVVANLDVFGKGVITQLYQAAVAAQGGPLFLLGARKLMAKLRQRDTVMIATGFPERAWIARPIVETDGPPGAATLARCLYRAKRVIPVILIDEPFVSVMEDTCRGAGMVPLDLEYFGNLKKEDGFQAVFVVGVPFSRLDAHKLADELLEGLKPAALVAIERPGHNAVGAYHQVGGERIPDDAVADLDYIFNRARESGLLTLGVGDGGNEIGMGQIENELGTIVPATRKCKCPCGCGSGASTRTDVLLTGTCSNWAVTALEAAIALVTGDRQVLHDVNVDYRTLEACASAGGIDGGVNYNTVAAVDDIPWSGYRAVVEVCWDIVDRALGRP